MVSKTKTQLTIRQNEHKNNSDFFFFNCGLVLSVFLAIEV